MQSREFLALADQLQAFQTIMSGSLKKETEEAKQALAELGSAKELKALEASMGKIKDDHDAYVSKVAGEIEATEKTLEAKRVALLKFEAELQEQENELTSKKEQAKAEVRLADSKLAEIATDVAKAEKKLASILAQIEKAKQDISQREEAVASREAEVEKKLSIIKSLG